MAVTKRSEYELKKLADWWLDLSKLAFGSIVIPLLFTDIPGWAKLTAIVSGLTGGIFLARMGLNIARLVEK